MEPGSHSGGEASTRVDAGAGARLVTLAFRLHRSAHETLAQRDDGRAHEQLHQVADVNASTINNGDVGRHIRHPLPAYDAEQTATAAPPQHAPQPAGARQR